MERHGALMGSQRSTLASLDLVGQRLEAVSRIKSSLPVLVDAMPDVPLGHVIDVFDLARSAGFEKVQFATGAG